MMYLSLSLAQTIVSLFCETYFDNRWFIGVIVKLLIFKKQPEFFS